MRREVARTAVSLSLDDTACGFAVDRAMHDNFADTLPRDGQHRLRIKLARQFSEILSCDGQT
jgi:hypothetical protein